MKAKRCLLFVVIALTMGLAYGQGNKLVGETWKPYLVTDFGAKGDGKTDDTDAIQRCITNVEKKNYKYYKAVTAYPEIVFPAGHYLISRPLVIAATERERNLSIRGEGKVVIEQRNSDKDIFYMHNGYLQSVENITFSGGKTQIKFFSRNLNRAQLLVRNCHFLDSSDYAIDDSLKGVHHLKIVDPYEIEWKNSLPYAKEVDVSAFPDVFYTSSVLHIDNCEFINCMKVGRLFADWGIISNSKIITNPAMNGAAIYSRGVLKIKDTSCFAKTKTGANQRFVDNINAGVMLHRVNIDTDGIGFCPIYNRRVYDNGGLYNVYAVIDECNIKAAGSAENSFVYCEEVPNLISITNSKEMSGKQVPAVNFRMPVTKAYLQYVSFPELVKRLPELSQIYGYMVKMPRIYTIDKVKYQYNFAFALHNNKNLDCKLPQVLEPFVNKVLSVKAMSGFKTKTSRVNREMMKKPSTINVRSFGAVGDGRADDTGAIQQAIDVAAAKNAELIFPAGLYNISKTLTLPKDISIHGAGSACFKSNNGTKTLFSGKGVRQVSFFNIGFSNVENGIDLTTSASEKANILLDHCYFSGISAVAVKCLSGNGEVGEQNRTELRITDCVYGLPGQAVISNAKNTLFDYNWISLVKEAQEGAFVNKGTMQIIDSIGVPSVNSTALWIKNYHELMLDNMRFGGEGRFKKKLIENNSQTGRIYMRYSWLSCTRGTVITCNKVPEIITLFANFGPPAEALQIMLAMKEDAKGQKTDFLHESCNIIPTNFE